MTIDIEKLIEEVDEDGSGEIEFDEFKELLSGGGGGDDDDDDDGEDGDWRGANDASWDKPARYMYNLTDVTRLADTPEYAEKLEDWATTDLNFS